MGNSVLVVSGYFKKDTTTTAADKMARVLEAEAAACLLYTSLHYAGYIRYFSKVNGQVNAEVEDYVKQRLIDCQFTFEK